MSRTLAIACLALLAGACAAPFERPGSLDVSALRARATTEVDEGIRVSAAVPSAEESRAIFGVDLPAKGVEPVWLEIENGSSRRIWLLPTGLDPEYFSPREVSFGFHTWLSGDSNAALDEHLEYLNFESPVQPGATVSGFVYTNAERAAKVITVDVFSGGWATTVTMVVPIPGSETGAERLALVSMLTAEARVDVDDEGELRSLLEKLPCCTTDAAGEPAEPLNIVLIGELGEVAPAFQRRNFRYVPVEPRYVLGRVQDLSGDKQSLWVPGQPHVVRLWLTDMRFRGDPVWLGQVSTPLGGRFAEPAGDATARPIEPDVDTARNDVVQDLMYSQMLAKLGFVKGVGRVSASSPRPAPGGGSYYTDGLRAVFLMGDDNSSLSEIGLFDWERLADHQNRGD